MLSSIIFEYPKLLYLELILIPIIGYYIYKELKTRTPVLIVPSASPYMSKTSILEKIARHIPFVLRLIAMFFLIMAIARPRVSSVEKKVDSKGIDIVLDLDVSTSMLAQDFTPDRIGAAKDIAIQFIAERPSDRIGVVVFAGESYTQAPLTTDRATLINLMKGVQCGLIEDGTAIGNGLSTAIARLKDSKAKSKVIILLTDGVNNSGEIAPEMAIEIAKTYGVRVYTIGVGAMGEAPYPMMTPYGVQMTTVKVEIDEDLLKKIASETGGAYFRATDNTKLMEIYKEINKMEKNKTIIESFPVYEEKFMSFALVALAALLLELVMKLFKARRIL